MLNTSFHIAIMCDQETAVLLDERGVGTIVSNLPAGQGKLNTLPLLLSLYLVDNYAYFMQTTKMPSVCEPGKPLSISNISVSRVQPAGQFDAAHWRASGPGQFVKQYQLGAVSGELFSSGNGGHIY